jgi:hypothetical protein
LVVGGRPGARKRAGVFLLGAVLVVGPWTARNWVVFHAFVPVSLMGGRALWEGNTDLPRNEVYARYDAVGGPNALVDRHRLALHEAVRNILSRQPGWLFEKLVDQVPHFFAADNLVIVHVKRAAYGAVTPAAAWTVAGVTLVPYLAALFLFGWGLPRLPPTRPQGLLLTFAGYYLLIHVVVHAFSRYRLPAVPVLLLVAANAWVTRKEPWPRRRGRGGSSPPPSSSSSPCARCPPCGATPRTPGSAWSSVPRLPPGRGDPRTRPPAPAHDDGGRRADGAGEPPARAV